MTSFFFFFLRSPHVFFLPLCLITCLPSTLVFLLPSASLDTITHTSLHFPRSASSADASLTVLSLRLHSPNFIQTHLFILFQVVPPPLLGVIFGPLLIGLLLFLQMNFLFSRFSVLSEYLRQNFSSYKWEKMITSTAARWIFLSSCRV